MLSILLIDDNPNDRLMIDLELRKAFAEVEIKSPIDAKTLEEMLATGGFDVVITDYQLRWSDGLTVLKKIKTSHPNCPVIMCTDSGSEAVAVECMKAGLSDYVFKGRYFQRLARAVAESFEKHQLRQEYAKTAAQLAISEERLRVALESSKIGIRDWNILTGEVVLSEEHERLFGLEIGSFGGTYEAFMACIHPIDRESIAEAMAIALENKTEYKKEFRVIWPDGSERWIATRGKFVCGESGDVTRSTGVIWDITDRKLAVAKLQESEENLRFALEAGNTIAFTWDIASGEVRRSSNAETHIGLNPYTTFHTFEETVNGVHPEDRARFLADVEAALRGTGPYESEHRHLLADGSVIWLHDKGRVVFDESGKPVRLFGVAVDITERKQLEYDRSRAKARERSYQRRRQKLISASVALNSTLSVAEIVQLAADRARSILEVHQAAVNLNAIGNWERGISKFSLSEKYAKWRDYSEAPDGTGIYREIAQQQLPMRMTQAELEAHPAWRGFGKSADKHPPMRGWLAVPLTARNGKNLGIIQLSDKYDESEFGEDNVISIVDEALNTVRLAADAKSIDLRLTIVPQESESSEFGSFTEVSGNSNSALNPRFLVLGDANRLQQVIWNLLTNAVKFTPHGGRVEIRLREVDSSVELAVTDTGIGIAADFLPYVFESFRQADATITRNYSGLGLGLAIVRQLVELHGGTVWAESGGLDMGATFTFRLPACSPNSIASEEPGMPAGGANLEGIQVLVVDDEVDSLEFLAFVLSDYGAQVRAAASAAEAFQAASEFLPDVLVSDIGMPEEDGYSLLARLRSLAGGGKFGAIALTAYARDEDRERALAAGFDRHLAKPVEAEALLEAIVKLVIGNW